MRFTLVDRIIELVPGQRLTAIKNLSLAEEYLADHFPGFPVLPGVLMLEAMTQAGAWLIRATEDFQHSVVLLKEARNVKYASFVEPGQTLTISVEITDWGESDVKFKAQGTVGEKVVVSARLVLERYSLADRETDGIEADEVVRDEMRSLFGVLNRAG